jgi:dihydroorotate dehydrogenase
VFRVPECQAVINRYGFNSDGHHVVASRLRTRVRKFVQKHALSFPSTLFAAFPPVAFAGPDAITQLLASSEGQEAAITDALNLPRSLHSGQVLAVNLGKNKTSAPDSIDDFVEGVRYLGPYADVLVINVSSPNTPGLRDLQRKGMLEELLGSVAEARNSLKGRKPPLLVKIAPDLQQEELEDIGLAALASGIDGIIVSNTTIARPTPGFDCACSLGP